MNCYSQNETIDFGSCPYVSNISNHAMQNLNFRTAIWTGNHLQMTLMSIPPCGEIGQEMHPDTDQLLRIEQGIALVKMGKIKNQWNFQQSVSKGDAIFVPAGTWHNVINMGKNHLKVSSVYAPPNHPWGIVHHTKADAEREEYDLQ